MNDFTWLQTELDLSQQDMAMLLGNSQSLLSKYKNGQRSLGPLADGFLSQAIRVLLTLDPIEPETIPPVDQHWLQRELSKMELEHNKKTDILQKVLYHWNAGIKKKAWVVKMRLEPDWNRGKIELALNRFERDATQLINTNGQDIQQQLSVEIELLQIKIQFLKDFLQ